MNLRFDFFRDLGRILRSTLVSTKIIIVVVIGVIVFLVVSLWLSRCRLRSWVEVFSIGFHSVRWMLAHRLNINWVLLMHRCLVINLSSALECSFFGRSFRAFVDIVFVPINFISDLATVFIGVRAVHELSLHGELRSGHREVICLFAYSVDKADQICFSNLHQIICLLEQEDKAALQSLFVVHKVCLVKDRAELAFEKRVTLMSLYCWQDSCLWLHILQFLTNDELHLFFFLWSVVDEFRLDLAGKEHYYSDS